MILYLIICALLMIGMILDVEYDCIQDYIIATLLILFSSILVPIIIGNRLHF